VTRVFSIRLAFLETLFKLAVTVCNLPGVVASSSSLTRRSPDAFMINIRGFVVRLSHHNVLVGVPPNATTPSTQDTHAADEQPILSDRKSYNHCQGFFVSNRIAHCWHCLTGWPHPFSLHRRRRTTHHERTSNAIPAISTSIRLNNSLEAN
jgi:hypothetical protein